MASSITDGVFEKALKQSKDITDTYYTDFGQSEFDESRGMDPLVIRTIRSMMERRKPGIFRLDEIAAPFLDEAASLLSSGDVAAVDGTNAVAPMSVMNSALYASAVVWVTSNNRGSPVVEFTKATTSIIDRGKLLSAPDLAFLIKEMDEARDQESWPTTFREYNERKVALRCPARYVFVDGPIFTQNLATQPSGRAILGELVGSEKIFIGVIKDLRSSWATSKLCGHSLNPGEGYVISTVAENFCERFKDAKIVSGWSSEFLPKYVRGVYRPAQKAFGFECREDMVGMAVALIMADKSATIGHEIPLLLEIADAQVRASADGVGARNILVGRMWGVEHQMALDLTDERDLR